MEGMTPYDYLMTEDAATPADVSILLLGKASTAFRN